MQKDLPYSWLLRKMRNGLTLPDRWPEGEGEEQESEEEEEYTRWWERNGEGTDSGTVEQ